MFSAQLDAWDYACQMPFNCRRIDGGLPKPAVDRQYLKSNCVENHRLSAYEGPICSSISLLNLPLLAFHSSRVGEQTEVRWFYLIN
jgi:hypothetical protein